MLLELVTLGSTLNWLQGTYDGISRLSYEALGFLTGFFQLFAFIAILCMCPAADFKPAVVDPTSQEAYPDRAEPVYPQAPYGAPQQQYAANQPPTAQPHYAYQTSQNPTQQYYNQMPVYNGPAGAPEVRS